jgi:hypothetical protein
MPYSYEYFKKEFHDHLLHNFDESLNILDVGPGCGTYGKLLGLNFNNIDACEIFEPYIDEFKLHNIYRCVHNMDVLDIDLMDYDYVIFGDVIEHLSIDNAKMILEALDENLIYCMVAVPYCMEQGEVGGNIYETHLQDDLTHEIFLERYPMMRLLFKNDVYGLYVNYY